MEWNRSETLALAAEKCGYCRGMGQIKKNSQEAPCGCVLRAIFRACYKRFRECVSTDLSSSRSSLERGATKDPGGSWGRRNEEYAADFLLIAKRTLDEQEYQIFRFHMLLGADWKMCTRRLKMEKGQFFHSVYRIQQKLGKTFRELQPYPLYPLNEYFTPALYTRKASNVVEMPKLRPSLNVPLKRAA